MRRLWESLCTALLGDKILRDITETVQLRHDAELRRAELIQRANDLQALVKEKKEKINRVRNEKQYSLIPLQTKIARS